MMRIFLALMIIFFSLADLSVADWDRNFIGINYKGFPASTSEIDADLALLGPRFGYIRTYNSLFGPSSPENAVAGRVAAYDLTHPSTPIKVALGVALTPGDPTDSKKELCQAIANAKTYSSVVNAVVVGNENLGNISETDLINYINYAKTQLSGTGVTVTTCQTWGVLYGHPNLVNACTSYVLANIYPYWDGPGYNGGDPTKAGADTLKNWQARFLADYNQLIAKYGAVKIRIGETGWPSGGSQVLIDGHYTGIPSQTAALPNEQTYVEQYGAWAASQSIFTYLFSSFDEAWKTGEPGNVGPYWGIYTADSQPKWTFGQLPSVSAGTTLWLGTDSPYGDLTFSGGTLQIIDPQTIWPNSFNTLAGTTSTLDTAGNYLTLTGTLNGSGNLTQTGGGTVILLGNGAGFSGAYIINAGALNLSNTLGAVSTPCNVVVNSGGFLSGTGTVVGSLTNSGTVSPGNSPGTLNVMGSYTQTGSGTLRAEIASPSNYDIINVTGAPGTASLAGAIAPTLLNGYQPRGNQVFPGVVTAAGGVSGSFSSIINQQFTPTLFWQTRYNPNSVDLWVQRNYTNSGLGLNSNQQGVGTMLNGLAGSASGDLDNVLNAIDYLPDSGSVQNAFKQISPEKAGALASLGFIGATFQMRNLATRTTNLRFVQGEGSSLLSGGGLSCNYSKLDGLMLAYNGASLSNLFSARKEFQAPEGRWGVYVDGGAAFGSQHSSVNQTGYNFTLGGFTLGADYRLRDNLLVGLATGYSNTSSGFYGSGGSVNVNTVPFNAYAAYFPGSLYAYGSLGYALNLYDLKRGINFGGLARSASSSTTGNQFNLYGENGYDLKLSRFILTPSATLAYSGLWVNGLTETGAGALNLKVGPQSANSVQTGVGSRVTVPLMVGGAKVVPQAYAFYQHEFANGSRGLNASLSQGSSAFNFQTDAAKRNFALVGASVTAGLKKNLYAQVNYNAEVGRTGSSAHAINAGLRWEF
jgi:outer membrane autotransporter protein